MNMKRKIVFFSIVCGFALAVTSCMQDVGESFQIQFENKGSQPFQYMLGTSEAGKFKPLTTPVLVESGKISDFIDVPKGTYIIFWGLKDSIDGYKTVEAIRLFAGQRYRFTSENANYQDPKPVG